jgi:hypothetical protein
LHHVVALELAMNEDIEPDLLLPADRIGGDAAEEGLVAGIIEGALGVGRAGVPDLFGLRGRIRSSWSGMAAA